MTNDNETIGETLHVQRFPEPVAVQLPDGRTVMLTGFTGVSVKLDGCGTTVSDTVSFRMDYESQGNGERQE